LAPATELELLRHLDTCERCQRIVEQLAGSDEHLLAQLNELRAASDSHSAVLEEVLRSLKLERPRGAELSPDDPSLVPFLQPDRTSGYLGKIGPFEVLQVIGRGGMGVVLKARDPSLNRLNAIKVLLPQIASRAAARSRFRREARAAAAINHPHVVTIFSVDEFRGFPYLVMEYVEGESLQHRLTSQRPLDAADVIRVGIQVASALEAAHARGVVHRDIKPANILLQAGGDQVKITDFGLAQIADEMQLTQSGAISGTPPYMSPEQSRGEPLDPRSDLFSLGSVLYAMSTTGKSPFQSTTAVDTLRRICDDTPPPVCQANRQIPEGLSVLIERLMAKDRRERIQTASEVVDYLQRLPAGTERHTELLSPAAPVPRLSNLSATRHSSIESGGRGSIRIPSPSIAVLPFANMSSDPENEYFSDGLSEDLINSLTRVENLYVVARSSAFQYKGERVDVRDIGRRLNVATVLDGSVRKAGNRIRISAQLIDVASGFHMWSEQYDREWGDIFGVQDEITQTIVEALKGKLSVTSGAGLVKRHTDDAAAYSRYLRGRYYWNKREPAALRRAIEYYDQALTLDPDYAVALAGKADCQVLLADYALIDQQQALESAKHCATRALKLDESLAEAHKSMGFVLALHDHDWVNAERHFQRALELDPHEAATRLAYALTVLLPLGRFEDAAAQTERAVELDPVTPMIVAGPAVVATYQRRFEHATRVFEEALELDPINPVVNLWSCVLWIERGDWQRAETAIRRARPFQLLATELEGVLAARAGRKEEADAILARLHQDQASGQREATLSVARIYSALGDTERALTWLERAVNERIVATILLGVDPCYDPLRKDARFAVLLQKLGLAP
jgi:serine/threonine-protein kinase